MTRGDRYAFKSGEATLTEYVYDALGRRIQSIDHSGGSPVTTRYVYDGQRVIAEYDGAMNVQRYFIDGPLYIDEHVLFVDKTGPEDRAYYYLLKDLYTVAGLVDESGEVVEAYGYDAYGKVRMYRVEGQVADADRDGDVDMSDFECLQRCFSGDGNAIPAGFSAEEISQLDIDGDADIDAADMDVFRFCWAGPNWELQANGDYDEDGWVTLADVDEFFICLEKNLPLDPQCLVFDFDGDGWYDAFDYGTLSGLVGQQAGAAWSGCVVVRRASEIGNPYYFTGRRLDAAPLAGVTDPAQLYHYRARWYDPVHGRFGQRDPQDLQASDKRKDALNETAGSRVGQRCANLYEFASNDPLARVDPDGWRPLTLTFDAFIPSWIGQSALATIGTSALDGTWFDEPGGIRWWVSTDNRGFEYGNRTASRLYTEVEIETNDIGHMSETRPWPFVRTSTGFSVRARPIYGIVEAAGLPIFVVRYETESRRASFTTGINITDLGLCRTEVTVWASAGYPMGWGWGGISSALNPNIDYRVTFLLVNNLTSSGGSAGISVFTRGTHNQFPAYEAYVDGRNAYTYDPAKYGIKRPNIWNLNTSTSFDDAPNQDYTNLRSMPIHTWGD